MQDSPYNLPSKALYLSYMSAYIFVLRRFLFAFFLLPAAACVAQINAGMPLVKDVVTHFCWSYVTPNSSSSYEFQKKPEGWYVRLYDGDNGGYQAPQLYWSRKDGRYHYLTFKRPAHPDSASVKEELREQCYQTVLEPNESISYDRNLFYGYDGWQKDVMSTVKAIPVKTDSLWETLATAYDYYANGYILPPRLWKTADGDPDRADLNDTVSLPISRIEKFIAYENKCLAALHKIDSMNPGYQCKFRDIKGQLNEIRMSTALDLTELGYESLASPFIKAVSYPDPVLRRAREILRQLPPNSLLFTDGDTITYPIAYLQAKGERRDVIAIDNGIFLLRGPIGYLDRKYGGALFHGQLPVFKDPAFVMAYYKQYPADTSAYRLDRFLATIDRSPDTGGYVQIDTSLGRLYRYYSTHLYIDVDVAKAKRFYPGIEVGGRISFYLWGTTLELADILNFDMVNTNLLNRHIFFTNPSEHKMFRPYCVRAGQGVYEFVPRKFTPPLDYLPDWPWPPEWYENRPPSWKIQPATNESIVHISSLTTRTCYRSRRRDS